ncbi:MAG: SCO family protein [Mycobacteriales bacterium]
MSVVPPAARRPLLVLLLATALVAGGLAYAATRPVPPGPPAASVGQPVDIAVPAIPLLDEAGRATSLAAFRGRIVVLADFLTSCQETCPITTGSFLAMQRAVAASGLGSRVVFVEVSVDPGRDTPARLAAYARYTGADYPLLTGTPARIAALWQFFGVAYQRVPEGRPPGIDWQTGRPYTYDVAHQDALFFLDAAGRERFVILGSPIPDGALPGRLTALLDARGRQGLAHPDPSGWTVPQAQSVISWLAGVRVRTA